MSELIERNLHRETVIAQEGLDSLKRYFILLQAGEHYLRNTAFVKDEPWSEEDVTRTRNFLIDVAPFTHPKVNPSYWEHLILASIYAREIAHKINLPNLNPHEAESLLLLHDIGRLVIPHRYLRNDLIANRLFLRMGVKQEYLQKQTDMLKILGLSSTPYTDINDIPDVQKIIDVADNIGKKDKDGNLFNIESMVHYDLAQPTRYIAGVWPSENAGKKALVDGKQRLAIQLVLEQIDWLRQTFGIDFDKLREEVATEYSLPHHQELLMILKNNQETLDSNVDQLLGKPPVKAVVFDIGNVLLCGPGGRNLDEAFMEKAASDLNTNAENVTQAITKIVEAGMLGKITEEENLRFAWQYMNLEPPNSLEKLRAPFVQPDVYIPDKTLQKLIQQLAQNPNLEIYVLTDGILPLSTVAFDLFNRYYLPIDKKRYLISNEIGAWKRDGGAFKAMFDRLGDIDPLSTLLIDDSETNISMFRSQFGGRGLTYRGNPYQNISAQQRTVEEFQKAKLIPIN